MVAAVGQRTCRSVAQTWRHSRGRQLTAGQEGGHLYSRGGARKTLRQTLNTLRAFQLPADYRSWGSVEGCVRMLRRLSAGHLLPLASFLAIPQHASMESRTSLGLHERPFAGRTMKSEVPKERDRHGILGLRRSPHPITPASPNTIALDSVLSWAVNITTLGI